MVKITKQHVKSKTNMINTFSLLFINRLAIVSTGWNPNNSRIPADADPTNLAVPDSFLFPDWIAIASPLLQIRNQNILCHKLYVSSDTSTTSDFILVENRGLPHFWKMQQEQQQQEEEQKDVIIFITKEEMEKESTSSPKPSSTTTESQQEEAYNPETGEINWDCPCIAGMTKPPCGDSFKEAFSCFVYSTTEPKGADCIDQFKAMQACFQEHPDIYGGELDEEEDIIEKEVKESSEEDGVGQEESNQKKSSDSLWIRMGFLWFFDLIKEGTLFIIDLNFWTRWNEMSLVCFNIMIYIFLAVLPLFGLLYHKYHWLHLLYYNEGEKESHILKLLYETILSTLKPYNILN